jgi:hypothetical protein
MTPARTTVSADGLKAYNTADRMACVAIQASHSRCQAPRRRRCHALLPPVFHATLTPWRRRGTRPPRVACATKGALVHGGSACGASCLLCSTPRMRESGLQGRRWATASACSGSSAAPPPWRACTARRCPVPAVPGLQSAGPPALGGSARGACAPALCPALGKTGDMLCSYAAFPMPPLMARCSFMRWAHWTQLHDRALCLACGQAIKRGKCI